MSDDGRHAIVIIAMIGNPFSPRYARARARGVCDPLEFCAMNVALYAASESRAQAWVLDERRVRPEQRGGSGLEIGKSSMRWAEDRLIVELDERTTPIRPRPRRAVRGRITLHPEALTGRWLDIDTEGRHRWWPVAPLAHIEVELVEPNVRFRGHAYHDVNAGDVPLESTFEMWSWSRARLGERACLTYDVECVSGERLSHAFTVAQGGELEPLPGTRLAPLARSAWRLERHARVDEGAQAEVVRALEDGPFYARALIGSRLAGQPVIAVHETLAAHRLRRAWVRFCTSYRMRVHDCR